MSTTDIRTIIEAGRARLGVEFGSTRIKAVLTDPAGNPIAQGAHDWENQLVNNIWTYDLKDVWTGLQDCYAKLLADVKSQYGASVKKLEAIGFSAMMHGYIPFDENGNQLAPFRTWRNTITGQAAEALTERLSFNIPQRWSIAHLYQAILNGEEHVSRIAFLTTLAGYVHWQLTGVKAVGVGEASGMFPIDSNANDYDAAMIDSFDALVAEKGFPWKLRSILPKVLVAGESAGALTAEGAKLLDVSGQLEPGAPLCPPEGDAGTGMVATNSVAQRTGNVSAGTSVFAMIVLEEALKKVHPEIDMVTTPTGKPVAMVHCNNCTSDLNAWVKLFGEFAEAMGFEADANQLFGTLYRKALEADADLGGLLAYNYFSGESITGFEEGRPLFARTPDSRFTLANFMRTHLYAALATLKIGMDILLEEENVKVDQILGHGGLFKTKGVGQRIMAAAMNTPVSVMETAGEGGAWGIALLAGYMVDRAEGETLESYLSEKIFAGKLGETIAPDKADVDSFNAYIDRYTAGLPIERAAVESIRL
ncbi:MAG: FGGY-family carbohydrate kinase [Clostridia bacterium]|nr:FGGY-family carbohydrate kinase [Clostridia bacterium]